MTHQLFCKSAGSLAARWVHNLFILSPNSQHRLWQRARYLSLLVVIIVNDNDQRYCRFFLNVSVCSSVPIPCISPNSQHRLWQQTQLKYYWSHAQYWWPVVLSFSFLIVALSVLNVGLSLSVSPTVLTSAIPLEGETEGDELHLLRVLVILHWALNWRSLHSTVTWPMALVALPLHSWYQLRMMTLLGFIPLQPWHVSFPSMPLLLHSSLKIWNCGQSLDVFGWGQYFLIF